MRMQRLPGCIHDATATPAVTPFLRAQTGQRSERGQARFEAIYRSETGLSPFRALGRQFLVGAVSGTFFSSMASRNMTWLLRGPQVPSLCLSFSTLIV